MSDHILETRNLIKEFKGFVAVNDVSIKVRRGQIHALIGPNGAGKTTFFNLLTKFLIPTSGTILYNGQDITPEKPAQIARRGIIRSFQISAVFPHLTVLENVRIGLQRKTGLSFHFWKPESALAKLDARAMELLDEVGLTGLADSVTVELPYGRKRALEIATTLALDPELMLLDEPTQGMGHEDVDRVTSLTKKVSANRTILMVEHNMNVVATIADTITVLQRGAVLAEGPYAEVSANPLVKEAYMGTADAVLAGDCIVRRSAVRIPCPGWRREHARRMSGGSRAATKPKKILQRADRGRVEQCSRTSVRATAQARGRAAQWKYSPALRLKAPAAPRAPHASSPHPVRRSIRRWYGWADKASRRNVRCSRPLRGASANRPHGPRA